MGQGAKPITFTMSDDKYFRFPLAILQGINENGKPCNSTPFDIIDNALSYGIVNAGVGLIKTQGQEHFEEVLADSPLWDDELNLDQYAEAALVGASMCGVKLGGLGNAKAAGGVYERYQKNIFPLVTMKADIFWSAFYQTGYEQGRRDDRPERGISWREFRILCAILSGKTNRDGFWFGGWQQIQARSCGMLKKPYKAAKRIPGHLTPPYSQKQIKRTCDTLEALNFFARCRHSKGARGGFMAYSFKQSREDLREAVARWASFRRGDSVRENRAKDLVHSLKNQERA